MAYQLKNGEGSLWPAKEKKSEQSPNTTGKIMLDGKIIYLSGWTNTSGDGTKWVKIKARWADDSQQAPQDKAEDPFI